MDYTDLVKGNENLVVEFFATWCPHCQRMMPVVEQIRELLGNSVQLVQLDIDKNQQAASEAGVESIPTFIVYKNGVEKWRQSGEMDGEYLLSKIQSALR